MVGNTKRKRDPEGWPERDWAGGNK